MKHKSSYEIKKCNGSECLQERERKEIKNKADLGQQRGGRGGGREKK